MTGAGASFARIKNEVARDLGAVTPLKAPSVSALVTLPLGIFVASIVLVGYGLRADAAVLGTWPLWGPPFAMAAAAYVLVVLALRERIPGASASWIWWVTLPVLAIAVQLGGAFYTFRHAPPTDPAVAWSRQSVCLWHISLLALPSVLVVLWLLSRGLTLRPRLAGLMSGVAGGVLTEGIFRLHCGWSEPSHILPWHTGAILATAGLGLLGGVWWERRRLEAWGHDHDSDRDSDRDGAGLSIE